MRYFQAQIGDKIVFRASATKVYASASISKYGIGFSGKPAGSGSSPTVEITKADYDRLVAIKTERLKTDPHFIRWQLTGPQDSWITTQTEG